MALATDAFSTYDMIGIREDLSDMIWNIAPEDTPFYSSIPKTDATQTLHEWQTDTLAAPSASNFVLEGDEATTDASVATIRMSNTACISDKVPRVTGTAQAVTTAGRGEELAYQVVKRMKELKRDVETILLSNNAEVGGNTTTARETAGIEVWFQATTSSRDAGGSSGSDGTASDGNTAATDGDQRDLSEGLVKTVLEAQWTNGGQPDCILAGGPHKQEISGFTGNATRFKGAADSRLVANIDIYDSDFGTLEIKPARFLEGNTLAGGLGIRSVLIIQTDMWAAAQLRSPRLEDLSKTGDSERRLLVTEYALESRNALASGIVADLNF